ncbi:MAG: hypothetical protein U0T69_07130 [Chitinophagales bacterium]
MNKGISIIIPLFNEADGISVLVQTLNDFFKENNKISTEIIFVNGGLEGNSFKLQ